MKTSYFITCALLGMTLTSCSTKANNYENKQTVEETTSFFPTITEKGVEPFIIGKSVKNIPPKGEFYDSFKWEKTFDILVGDHYLELNEKEYKDYNTRLGEDEIELLGISSNATVIYEDDTLLVARCDESGIISSIEVHSSKLQLDNGIHVGLSSDSLFAKYKAIFLTTEGLPSGCWQAYQVPGLHKNITLRVFSEESDGSQWYWSVFDGMEPNKEKSQKVKDGDGENPSLYKIPLQYVKKCSLGVIDVQEGGIEMLRIK